MHNDEEVHLLKVTSHRLEQQKENEYKLEGQESASLGWSVQIFKPTSTQYAVHTWLFIS